MVYIPMRPAMTPNSSTLANPSATTAEYIASSDVSSVAIVFPAYSPPIVVSEMGLLVSLNMEAYYFRFCHHGVHKSIHFGIYYYFVRN